MGFSSSHNSTFQSRDCSSELDFATLRTKASVHGSRASVARELADTIGQHVDQVSVDISANTKTNISTMYWPTCRRTSVTTQLTGMADDAQSTLD